MTTPMHHNAIKQLRESRGLTQAQLAEQLGVSYQAVSTWENGLKMPRMGVIEKLSDFFGVPKSQIMGWEPQESSFNARDERDIQKSLDHVLSALEGEQGALLFDGEPLDDETKELLIASLERSIRMAKAMAKEKYTPEKYKSHGKNHQ